MMFTKGWLLWNHGATILSLAINLFMLVTWNAKASREDFDKHNQSITNQTLDRALLQDPIPRIGYVPHDHYTLAMYALGGTHNLLSLFVLISYFLSNHPRFPTKEEVKAPFRALCGGGNNGSGKKKSDDLTEKKPDEISKLDVKFFSFTTFYYMMFLAMSAAGTKFHGYFFRIPSLKHCQQQPTTQWSHQSRHTEWCVIAVGGYPGTHCDIHLCTGWFFVTPCLLLPWRVPVLFHVMAMHGHRHQIRSHWGHVR